VAACYSRDVSDDDDDEVARRSAAGQPPAQPAANFSNVEEIFSQFKDLFGDFFGGTQAAKREQGADRRMALVLTETEARDGCKREVEAMRSRICTECDGAGGFGDASACKDCSGSGKRNVQQGFFMIQTACGACGSAGKRWTQLCVCAAGLVSRAERITVVVPAGIQNGQILRLAGKGDELAGKPTGHLYLVIEIQGGGTSVTAPELGRLRDRGHDLVVDVAVRTRHLLFGGTLDVPTPDGTATVKVPRRVEDGHEIRLVGRGRPRATSAHAGDPYREMARGDLVAMLRVPPEVRKRREAIGFAGLVSVVIAVLVALSLR
jgi:molecular chaperone DnaJ